MIEAQVLAPVNHANAATAKHFKHPIMRDLPAGQGAGIERRGRDFGCACSVAVDRKPEPVAAARYSLDKTIVIGCSPQCRPKFEDGGIDAAVELDNRVAWPKPLANLFPRDHSSVAQNQQFKDPELLFRQAQSAPVPQQIRCLQVELEISKADKALHWCAKQGKITGLAGLNMLLDRSLKNHREITYRRLLAVPA